MHVCWSCIGIAILFSVSAWLFELFETASLEVHSQEVDSLQISEAPRVSAGAGPMQSLSYPAPDVITASSSSKTNATVILLHGLGDTSAGWTPVGMQMRSALPHVKWILPTAPTVHYMPEFTLMFAVKTAECWQCRRP